MMLLSIKKNPIWSTQSRTPMVRKVRNGLLYHGYVVRNMGPFLLIYNTVICVVYVDD